MTYRDDHVEEINRLTNELADATSLLERRRKKINFWRFYAIAGMISSFVGIGLCLFMLFFLAAKAPLSARTHTAGRAFCDALEKQEQEQEHGHE